MALEWRGRGRVQSDAAVNVTGTPEPVSHLSTRSCRVARAGVSERRARSWAITVGQAIDNHDLVALRVNP